MLVFPLPAQILDKLSLSNAFENMLSSQKYLKTVYAFLRGRGGGGGREGDNRVYYRALEIKCFRATTRSETLAM